MVPGDVIAARDLGFLDLSEPRRPRVGPASDAGVPLLEARDRFERDYIMRTLQAHQGNISRTADALGLERSNLYRKMRAFGIGPAAARGRDECRTR